MKLPFLIGRALFGGFFLYSGIDHFLNADSFTQYAGARHVPMPDAAVKASGVMMMIGGASILLGLKPKYGAATLVVFLAAASGAINNFWADEDPAARREKKTHFATNLALAGGALALAAVEQPWPASIEQATGPQKARTAWRVLAA